MKVVTKYVTNTDGWGDDSYSIEVNGRLFCSVGHTEPEDATISRDFNFVVDIPRLLAKAHAAGAAGEPLEIEELEFTDDDEWDDEEED